MGYIVCLSLRVPRDAHHPQAGMPTTSIQPTLVNAAPLTFVAWPAPVKRQRTESGPVGISLGTSQATVRA